MQRFNRSMRRVFLCLLGLSIILLVWYGGALYVQSRRMDLPPDVIQRLYPSPGRVIAAAEELPWQVVLDDIWLSSTRVLLGFLAASAVALPFGFAIGRSRFVAMLLEPANDFLRYLPVAGFSTLTIFLLGTGNVSAVLVVFIGTVFHLIVATADAVRRVPSAYLDLAHTMSYGPLRRLRRIIIPAASPAVFANLRVAVGWAWSYVTLAEIMGTEGGLGHAIEVSRRFIRTDQVLLWIAIVGVLGLLSDALMRWIGKIRFRWAEQVGA